MFFPEFSFIRGYRSQRSQALSVYDLFPNQHFMHFVPTNHAAPAQVFVRTLFRKQNALQRIKGSNYLTYAQQSLEQARLSGPRW